MSSLQPLKFMNFLKLSSFTAVLAALTVLCSCAGTTTIKWTSGSVSDTNVVGTYIYYSTNPALTNSSQDASALLNLGATQVDAGTNSKVVISGLSGRWYFTGTSYSLTGESSSAAGVAAYVPTNDITLTITNR